MGWPSWFVPSEMLCKSPEDAASSNTFSRFIFPLLSQPSETFRTRMFQRLPGCLFAVHAERKGPFILKHY